jgi:hypothetical protein
MSSLFVVQTLILRAVKAAEAIDLSANRGLYNLRIFGIRFLADDPDWVTPLLSGLDAPEMRGLELVTFTAAACGDEADDLMDTFSLDEIDWEALADVIVSSTPNLRSMRISVLIVALGVGRPMSNDEIEDELKDRLRGLKGPVLEVSFDG